MQEEAELQQISTFLACTLHTEDMGQGSEKYATQTLWLLAI